MAFKIVHLIVFIFVVLITTQQTHEQVITNSTEQPMQPKLPQSPITKAQDSLKNSTPQIVDSNITVINKEASPQNDHIEHNNSQQPPIQSEKIVEDNENNMSSTNKRRNNLPLKQRLQQSIGSMTEQQKNQLEQKLAQSSRSAYEHYKKIRQDQRRKQQQQNEKLAKQIQLSKSQSVKGAQDLNFKQQSNKYSNFKRGYNQYLFEINPQSAQDFKISLPIEQVFTISSLVYAINDGVYSLSQNIEQEQPIWVYIYENNDRILSQKSFYFRNFIAVEGKANSTYLIRFVNHGQHRLISTFISNILEDNHINNVMTVEDVAEHVVRVRKVRQQLTEQLQASSNKFIFQTQNEKKLLTGLDHYYYYNIIQVTIIGLICVLQVEIIRKLLSQTSII